MKKIARNLLHLIWVITLVILPRLGSGCTDFMLANAGVYKISARTMDFAMNLKSELCLVPRGHYVQSILADSSKGISWTSGYGFIGMNSLGIDSYNDGLNEAGLSFATLWLYGTEYARPENHPGKDFISLFDIGSWILGNFSTVDEVREAMSNVLVCGLYIDIIKMEPPLHFVIHDAQGNSLVVEYIDGEPHFYDNKYFVTTNYPTFDWQMINLSNYVNLTNHAPNENVLKPTSSGSGMLGLPGDATSPSRFVRTYFLNRYCLPPASVQDAIFNALHILNNVDVVGGEIAEGGYTQWSVVRDHGNRVYYFRDYRNLNIRAIDLKKLDFDQPEIKRISVTSGGEWCYDVSDMF